MNWSLALKVELRDRAAAWSSKHGTPSYRSKGSSQTVLFEQSEAGDAHGNFHPASWAAIASNPEWSARTRKSHAQRHALPDAKAAAAMEVDSSNSSDALLMSCFCYPGATPTILTALDLHDPADVPEFGFKAKVPLKNGGSDATEVDMRIGNMLFEAKLTEASFTNCLKENMSRYRDFDATFDVTQLPMSGAEYLGYQLLRNVLATQATGGSFMVLIDQRRPDLLQEWWRVHAAIIDPKLRSLCGFRTWQQVAAGSPAPLGEFLEEKYGL